MAQAFQGLRQALIEFGRRDLEHPGRSLQTLFVALHHLQGCGARHGLDAPHSGRHAAFREDLEQADVTEAADMGTAA